MVGCTTCRMHGAKAPQVQQAARERLAALVHPSVSILHAIVTDAQRLADAELATGNPLTEATRERLLDARATVDAVLDRTGYHRRTGIDVEAGVAELQAVLDEYAEELGG